VESVPTAGNDAGGDDPGSPAQLRRLVAAHRPTDARESAAKERFLVELDRLDRPCDETADPVHATASAVVVGRRGTVLHLHRRLRRWMQPGGHIDPGESPPAAALRESEEETGLSLTHPPEGPMLVHLDVHQAAQGHTHLDLRYLLLGPDTDPDPPPGESPEARWYGWDEAEATADEALVGGLRVARELWDRRAESWGLQSDDGGARAQEANADDR
jgi:8-oxo-dGTP pyrophosphatase MutT (NUDIX family)